VHFAYIPRSIGSELSGGVPADKKVEDIAPNLLISVPARKVVERMVSDGLSDMWLRDYGPNLGEAALRRLQSYSYSGKSSRLSGSSPSGKINFSGISRKMGSTRRTRPT
jgi:hypothetical protein